MMILDVDKIRQRFAQAHSSYYDYATVQHIMVKQLIDTLGNYHLNPKNVLEIGCGVGNLTQQLVKTYPYIEHLYLNDLYDDVRKMDLSPSTTQFYYHIGDIQQLDLSFLNSTLDLIISSSTLQWIYPLDELLIKLYQSLNQDGYFVFSSFLTENLKQIKQLTGQGLIYYSYDELLDCVTQAGFSIEFAQQQQYELYFNSAYDVLKHLKYTGVTATTSSFKWSKQRLQQFYQDYQTMTVLKDGVTVYPLSYDTVYIIAKK